MTERTAERPERRRRRVDDLSPAEHIALGYPEVSRRRREEYRETAERITFPPEAEERIARLEAAYGPVVKAWHNLVPWRIGFLVGKYGENPQKWPDALGDADVERLRQMTDRGEMLNGLTPVNARSIGGFGEDVMFLGIEGYPELYDAREAALDARAAARDAGGQGAATDAPAAE